MITKFKTIKNLAVFQNFDWEKTVKEKDGSVKEFKTINILYGRNYSGKTTLSRIVRAMELDKLSTKYENPDFKVSIKGETEITPINLTDHNKKIRVFNEDFVRDNLKFIIDPDASIKSFAILGDDNNKIEEEIKTLEKELGTNEEGKETGLYKDLIEAEKKYQAKKKNHTAAEKKLKEQLSSKATGGSTSIKYNSDKYGKQNYNIRELDKDIKAIQIKKFNAISNEEQKKLEKLLNEKTLKTVPSLTSIELNLSEFIKETKELVERPVSESGKIEELVKDALLNKWVKEGRTHHKGKRDKCGFCGNELTDDRWELLEKHFDEESEKLEKAIDKLIEQVKTEKQTVKPAFKPSKNLFYSKFHSNIDELINSFDIKSKNYISALDVLLTQLQKRKDDLIHSITFEETMDNSAEVLLVWDEYEKIRIKTNAFTNSLGDEKNDAQTKLRLREVSDFLTTIKYTEQQKEISEFASQLKLAMDEKELQSKKIAVKEQEVESKKRELNDEEKGAKKVNNYLNDFFGHASLSLQAIEKDEDDGETKQIRFQVVRDRKEAHHLSEGECSLLAFCYFMAKLEDINTKGSKPIIWIDDPVSSLDGNHVFFVYSLL